MRQSLGLLAECGALSVDSERRVGIARETLRGTDMILTIKGNRRVLCTSVKITSGSLREVRVGRTVAPVARFLRMFSPPPPRPIPRLVPHVG